MKKESLLIPLLILTIAFSGCLEILHTYSADHQNYNAAVNNLDTSFCLKIIDQLNQRDCFWDVAYKKGDESACENAPAFFNTDSGCYTAVALSKGDYAPCYKTKFEEDKGKCIAMVGLEKGETGMCEGIEEAFVKGWCYAYVVEETKDASLCESIVRQEEGGRTNASFFGSAENPRDRCYFFAGKCDLVEDESIKSWCNLNKK